MKILVVLVMMFVGAVSAWAEPTRIDSLSVVFLYESRADPGERLLEDEGLASLISEKFKTTYDEFERHEMMKELKPIIDGRLAEAAASDEVFLVVRSQLGNYDFEELGFPTGLRPNTFIEYEMSYAVMFENGAELVMLPVEVEAAREVAGKLGRDRGVLVELVGEIVGWERRRINRMTTRVLYVRVNKVEVKSAMGRVVGLKNVEGEGELVTCAEMKAECGRVYEECVEGCKNIEDFYERTFCPGECRNSRSACASRC